MTGKLSSSVFYVLFGLMLFWANANAELPENVKFCIPKQYTVTYDCPAGGNAPTQQSTAYGNNFTTGVGCNNAPAWRVGDSDTIITSNTTIPYAYTHDIVLHADYSPWYTIAGGKLINADPDVYIQSSGEQLIRTNVVPANNVGVKTHFAYIQLTELASPIFATYSPHFYCGTNNGVTLFTCGYGPGSGYSNPVLSVNELVMNHKYTLMFNYNNSGYIIFDDVVRNINYFDFDGNDKNITLLHPSSDTKTIAKLYDITISRSNDIIRTMVPVPAGLRIGDYTVPSNGMWDMMEQKFHQNSGTSEFIYGRESE